MEAASSGLDLFCGEQFWDPNILNSSSIPVLSRCMQHTVFVWIPFLFVILTAPLIAFQISFEKYHPLPWTQLLSAKLTVACILIIDSAFLFLLAFYSALALDSLNTVDFVYPLMECFSMILMATFLMACQRYGKVTSGGMWLTWLLYTICGLPELYYFLNLALTPGMLTLLEVPRFVAFMIWYPCIVIELVLFSYADAPGVDFLKRVENEKRSEENFSSFINRQTMWWFNKICAIGIRKPLEASDLYALNPEDTSKVLVPKWTEIWDKAMEDYNERKTQAESRSRSQTTVSENTINDGTVPLLGTTNSTTNTAYGSLTRDEDEPKEMTSPPSIFWRLFILFKWDVISAMIIKCASDLLQFANPQLLSALIKFTENKNSPLWHGIGLAVLMFMASEMSSILLNNYYYLMYRVGTRIQAVLTAAVYKKTLVLSNAARREKTVGEIVNLMAIDVDRFQLITPQSQQYWSTPMQIALALFFLWKQVGYSVTSGVIVMLLLLPINFLITMQTRKYQLKQMAIKDERIKYVNEVLSGMKVIKLYAYEKPMEEMINDLRNKELALIKKAAFLNNFSDMLNTSSPFFVAATTFATFILSDPSHILTPEIAFVSLTLFNQLRTPMSTVAELISQTVQVFISNKRLKEFLVTEELENYVKQPDSPPSTSYGYTEDVIDVQDASFTWDSAELIPSLSNVNLSVSRGQLIAVIGKVGAGKSSLLSSLLGEMEKVKGHVGLRGTVAYVPQQAWIQNETVRNNIIFGRRFDEYFYNRVLDACALFPDLSILSNGDQTEIGEKGINLSGGQKSRINLARSVYQNHDVYLLDDPLSAVDAHVGKQLFTNVIGPEGILRNKTRILVTHELAYLRYADLILVMEDGKIQYDGSYAELNQTGALKKLLQECRESKPQPPPEDDLFSDTDSEEIYEMENTVDNMLGTSVLSTVSGIASHRRSTTRRRRRHSTAHESVTSTEPAIRQLTGVEKVESGQVKPMVYLNYFQAMGIGLSLMFIFGFVASTISSMIRNLWLTSWSNDNAKLVHNASLEASMPVGIRLGVYTAIGFAEVGFVFFGMTSLLFGGVRASRNLHSPLLHALFRAPMRFFDTTPFGRVLNRVGKDIETIDFLLPFNVEFFVQCVLQVLSTLVIIMISTPIFGIVVVPLTITYLIVLRYYIATSRQLKRLESISRSPIYSHLAESINGASTIRAYQNVERFCRVSEKKVDAYVQCRYLSYVANRWLSLRLEGIGNIVVLFAALFAALTRESTSAGILGLSISYSLNITFVLNFAVRQITKIETNIVSVERVKEYSEVESEADWIVPDKRPPIGWPSKGAVIFDGYATRYRPGLELVIKNITAKVEPGQKIGIVGRTGAGKSSLTLALFRLIEPARGTIIIDGVDIRQIGLHDLRSNITIIPQEPVLFSGTLRFNLDPFENFTDDNLWTVLELAHLKTFASNLSDGLDHVIVEGGDNISVGQRQLVCLARALLRRSKILVLDEATASVDIATDALIQETIRHEFADSSVFTIAHRLNTIMDYTKIMVLDKGEIVEFAPPDELLADRIVIAAMYNGVGIQTARGTGTSGYVQANLSALNFSKHKKAYNAEPDIQRAEAEINKKPNAELLDHEYKRRIEMRCVEMEDAMEADGYSAEEIEKKVSEYRELLFSEFEAGRMKLDHELDTRNTHARRHIAKDKRDRMRFALGIGADFVDGTSMAGMKKPNDPEVLGIAEDPEIALKKKIMEQMLAEKAKKKLERGRSSNSSSDSSSSSSSDSSSESSEEEVKQKSKKKKSSKKKKNRKRATSSESSDSDNEKRRKNKKQQVVEEVEDNKAKIQEEIRQQRRHEKSKSPERPSKRARYEPEPTEQRRRQRSDSSDNVDQRRGREDRRRQSPKRTRDSEDRPSRRHRNDSPEQTRSRHHEERSRDDRRDYNESRRRRDESPDRNRRRRQSDEKEDRYSRNRRRQSDESPDRNRRRRHDSRERRTDRRRRDSPDLVEIKQEPNESD